MKIKLLFLVIPLLVILNTFFTTQFSFWENRADPEYCYLLNGLNLANEYGNVGHYDHPGTTSQVFNAIVIKCVYSLSDTKTMLQDDVLKRPEYYLKFIGWTYALVSVALLFLFSLYVYKITSELKIALLVQLSAFYSQTAIVNGFYRVSPEPILFMLSIVFCFLVLKLFFENKNPPEIKLQYISSKQSKYIGSISVKAMFLGGFMGFCLATKITTMPFIIIFLFYLTMKQYIPFFFTLILSFLIFTFPIREHYDYFFRWIYDISIHSGYYGTGKESIFEINEVFKNIIRLLLNEEVIVLVFVITFYVIIKFKQIRTDKLLWSLLIMEILFIVMVIKHFDFHYLVPIYPVLSLNLFLILYYNVLSKYTSFFLIVILSILCLNNLRKADVKQGFPIISNDRINIYSNGCHSPHFALKFGDDFSNHAHSKKLKEIYGDQYFFNSFTKKFYDWENEIPIDSLISLDKKIYFFASNELFREIVRYNFIKGEYTMHKLKNNK